MDDNDKVRRNLVVFCGAVLIANYLDVSFTKLVTQFLKLDEAILDPDRVLGLSLVILIYLAVRYRFSDEGMKYSETLEKEWETLCLERVQRWCETACLLYVNRGIEFRGLFSATIDDILKATSGEVFEANEGKLPSLCNVQFGMSSTGPKIWRYQAFVKFDWYLPTSNAEKSTTGLVNVEFSGTPLQMLRALTSLQMWCYSKGSIHALIPVVLGNFAAATLTMKALNFAAALSRSW